MATVKFGISIGENYTQTLQQSGSAVTDDVEVTINDTVTKEQCVLLLKEIQEWITRADAI